MDSAPPSRSPMSSGTCEYLPVPSVHALCVSWHRCLNSTCSWAASTWMSLETWVWLSSPKCSRWPLCDVLGQAGRTDRQAKPSQGLGCFSFTLLDYVTSTSGLCSLLSYSWPGTSTLLWEGLQGLPVLGAPGGVRDVAQSPRREFGIWEFLSH